MTDAGATTELGLFPLRTVLVPGMALGVRVFEPRYLDLVRRCTREGSCFGVCLLLDDASAPAASISPKNDGRSPADSISRRCHSLTWGTAARVLDWSR